MKFLTFIALPLALQALTTFKNVDELIKCIQDCEQFVTPCIHDQKSDCQKVYSKCVNHEDPFTCLTSVNSLKISKIAKCFDEVCKQIKVAAVPEPLDFNEEEMAELQQFNQFNNHPGSAGDQVPAPEGQVPTPKSTKEEEKSEQIVNENEP